MAENIKNTMIIAEQDEDLSSSLSLFFSHKFKVIVTKEFEQINEHLPETRILLVESSILEAKGLDLLQFLKEQYPGIYIIVMVTAWTKEEWKEEIVKQNADALVYKPFDVGRISRIISQISSGNILSQPAL